MRQHKGGGCPPPLALYLMLKTLDKDFTLPNYLGSIMLSHNTIRQIISEYSTKLSIFEIEALLNGNYKVNKINGKVSIVFN